jgi:hypothetical protein
MLLLKAWRASVGTRVTRIPSVMLDPPELGVEEHQVGVGP